MKLDILIKNGLVAVLEGHEVILTVILALSAIAS